MSLSEFLRQSEAIQQPTYAHVHHPQQTLSCGIRMLCTRLHDKQLLTPAGACQHTLAIIMLDSLISRFGLFILPNVSIAV
jgi:hypothetical protein